MGKIVGTSGTIQSGSTVVGGLTEFSIDQATEVVEDTELGDTAKSFIADRTSWNASATVMYDKDDSGQDLMLNGAEMVIHIIPAGDATGNEDFSGDVIITGVSMPVAAGAMVTQAFTMQGTGVLAIADISA